MDYRNFLRFFWYEDNNPDAEIIEYRMCVHVFGNSTSPAVATYGLRKTVSDYVVQCDEDVRSFVEKDFYVDDALTSVETCRKAVSLLKRTQNVLQSEGQLRLHKIASNRTEVMKAFPKEDLAKHLKTVDLSKELLPLCHSLGLAWDLNRDVFRFLIQEDQLDKPYTRRGLLSVINSLFDPLGFLAPFTVKGKILLRELARKGTDWDEILPPDRQCEWNLWRQSLKAVEELSVSCAFVPISPSESDSRQVHIYCDASEKAIASVAYLMAMKDGQTHVGFVLGKAKVAPLHCNTIPRLELCAAVLSAEIAEFISEHLNISLKNMKFYTDSKVVLGYIGNDTRRFFIYVSNRVHKIRQVSTPSQWSYVHTSSNPADAATRCVQDMNFTANKWLSGPQQSHRDNPESKEVVYPLVNPQSDKEVKPKVVTVKTEVNRSLGVKNFEKFSSWTRLVNAIALLKDLVQRKKGKVVSRQQDSVQNFLSSQIFILLELQREVYGAEISCLYNGKPVQRQSPIRDLCPFLDQHSLLRVGGRLSRSNLSSEEKHPIIIPGGSHIAQLLAKHFHEHVQHQGRHLTEGAIRNGGFWIVGAKRLISSLLHKCVLCRKLRRPLEHQKMADLPSDRLTPGVPFSSVGVDTFGPWQVVTRRTRGGSANSKRWAVLFTCLTIRAIHIEVIEDLSSSSFINALKRFQSIRGKVTLFRSDRGTNFVGATDDLKIDTINMEEGPVQRYLYKSGCQWIFNAPHSSPMGGVWERMIGVVRRILDSLLAQNPNHLTHEVLVTFMAETCAIVNSRPITPVSSDPDCATVLSPSMILTQKSDSVAIPSGEFTLPIMYKHQRARVQQLADMFWERWKRISSVATVPQEVD
ncbi:uncharacterized protein LOC124284679 [Haliotis rubra]|uniref:uncharacterized protein LOC124284679 n=1 Tax=Haliotis rubra TaxID=36100 RepID=UPI001EE58ACE|nr:uncharacterized protein LOC124284679 [Haliotis rubra]